MSTPSEQSPTMRKLYNAAFIIMIFGLPAFVWYCLIAIIHYNGAIVIPDLDFWAHIPAPSLPALYFYCGWLGLQVAMFHLLPGKIVQGQTTENGSHLDYKLNGLLSFIISIGLFLGLHFSGTLSGSYIYNNLTSILSAANIIVFALCFYIYWLGRSQASDSEKQFNTIEAFFVGAARNPRNGSFDWKFFCESRPGLTFWVIVSLSCMINQYETYGTVTNSMMIASFFISLYIVDYYVVEDAVLTTWDIVHEPFGWMLCWGSLIYVPFFYPLSSTWLADNPYVLPNWAATITLVIGITGYIIFRQANIQKHHFRQGKNKKIWGKAPQYIQTQCGTKLLTSGWWGIASHANYLGDLMIALAMCLTVGMNTLLGYGYFLTFIVLLVHRDWRDNQHCANKYGEDWKAYRKKVRWHIVPGVY